MKKIGRKLLAWRLWVSTSSLALVLVIMGIPRLAETSPPPALLAGPLTNGFIGLTVSNPTNGEFYEIYRTLSLAPDMLNWTLAATGAVNVSNFAVRMDPALISFFKARSGNDWD